MNTLFGSASQFCTVVEDIPTLKKEAFTALAINFVEQRAIVQSAQWRIERNEVSCVYVQYVLWRSLIQYVRGKMDGLYTVAFSARGKLSAKRSRAFRGVYRGRPS